jgi:hypothetical protein
MHLRIFNHFFKYLGNYNRSDSQEKHVICKLLVIDFPHSSCETYSMHPPSPFSNSILLLKYSSIVMCSIGDNGKTFLSPLLILNEDYGLPFTIGAIHGDPIQSWTHLINSLVKPKFLIIINQEW